MKQHVTQIFLPLGQQDGRRKLPGGRFHNRPGRVEQHRPVIDRIAESERARPGGIPFLPGNLNHISCVGEVADDPGAGSVVDAEPFRQH
ncbi:hypothetical protein SDC9_184967 [bioreactor metagenome]|uniref:Uncharacterized protein n=1 Tax=bioreactor metagenome TaxID=1076179 RepID=A0A645HEI8_9ZZZZ